MIEKLFNTLLIDGKTLGDVLTIHFFGSVLGAIVILVVGFAIARFADRRILRAQQPLCLARRHLVELSGQYRALPGSDLHDPLRAEHLRDPDDLHRRRGRCRWSGAAGNAIECCGGGDDDHVPPLQAGGFRRGRFRLRHGEIHQFELHRACHRRQPADHRARCEGLGQCDHQLLGQHHPPRGMDLWRLLLGQSRQGRTGDPRRDSEQPAPSARACLLHSGQQSE